MGVPSSNVPVNHSHAASRAYERFFNVAALLLGAATLGTIALSRWG